MIKYWLVHLLKDRPDEVESASYMLNGDAVRMNEWVSNVESWNYGPEFENIGPMIIWFGKRDD